MRGSENTGALPAPGAINSQQYLLAAQGISGFVFDKRGTGRSGGKFVMNFTRLADEMAAASVEARRLAAGRFGRFGFWGGSQGGWVAPLAARNTGADFGWPQRPRRRRRGDAGGLQPLAADPVRAAVRAVAAASAPADALQPALPARRREGGLCLFVALYLAERDVPASSILRGLLFTRLMS